MRKKVKRKICRERRRGRVNPEAHNPDLAESRDERSAIRADFAKCKI
jgi:hypothetical protein